MKILIVAVAVLVVFYCYEFFLMYHRIQLGKEIAENTQAYEQEGSPEGLKILMIGDSTALGVGAANPEQSLAGLVGKRYPNATIVNISKNGMKVAGLLQQLESMKGRRFDLMMLHIGGNDIVRFTPLDQLEQDIEKAFTLAKDLAPNVTSTVTGNMGTATLFPFGSGWILEKRTRQVHQLFKDAAKKHDAYYVDLFLEREDDPFASDPKTFYAKDIFHPSEHGYALWFEQISKELDKIDLEKS